jgi:hypothetical protein
VLPQSVASSRRSHKALYRITDLADAGNSAFAQAPATRFVAADPARELDLDNDQISF